MSLTIIADENIPVLDEYFADFGHIRRVPGRTLSLADVRDADVLLVRSVTRVGAELLQGSRVRFVGSATIGTDHLDIPWLQKAGISFANAPGCNANSVVEYVLTALAWLHREQGGFFSRRVAIIGCGNVGGALYRRLTQLGVDCVACDPLLSDTAPYCLVDLDEALGADIICLHTPLTRGGNHPTWHLLGEEQLCRLRSGAVLINAGRGPVIDNTALLNVLGQRSDIRCVLDVWEWEPRVEQALLVKVDLGTPHIAGYSYDGKVGGTRMIASALAEYLGLSAPTPALVITPRVLRADWSPEDDLALAEVLLQAYDIRDDDARLRDMVTTASTGEKLAQGFDRLRKHYPTRLEWHHYRVAGVAHRPVLCRWLKVLGFQLD